jgi:hypothetical protein
MLDSRKLRGTVDGFTELNEKRCLSNAHMLMESQEVKFDDLRSKCGIPGGIPKNNITGSSGDHPLIKKSR